MDTAKLIPDPVTAPAGAMQAQAVAAKPPPWLEEADEPFSLPHRRLPRRVRPAGRPSPQAEMIHWSIAALTLITAISVLAGTFGTGSSRSQELLPIMITVTAR